MPRLIVALVFLGLIAGATAACSQPSAGPPPMDYAKPQSWVCRGDTQPCRDDLTAVVLGADGSRRAEQFIAAAAPPIDCFYVYPTVSHDPGRIASGQAGEDERRAVRLQIERLSSVCRLYVPAYRQLTATGMTAHLPRLSPAEMARAQAQARDDIASAWRAYLDHDNHGRGVVVIGHSQGAGILIDLIQKKIDGQPVQARLVSALLPGSFVRAPAGADVGGTFKHIPACRRTGQIACVIVFNSFRADGPTPGGPPPPSPDGVPLCTNPAALGGGAAALKPYLSTRGETIIPELARPRGSWTEPAAPITEPFVTEPGLLFAECRTDIRGPHLSISVKRAPGDHRTGELTGDWSVDGRPAEPTMGLHLIDFELVSGNLVDVIAAQAAAYGAR